MSRRSPHYGPEFLDVVFLGVDEESLLGEAEDSLLETRVMV